MASKQQRKPRRGAITVRDREPRATANRTMARMGEKATSALDPAGGKDPDRMPAARSRRERGNPRADRSVRSYKGRDDDV